MTIELLYSRCLLVVNCRNCRMDSTITNSTQQITSGCKYILLSSEYTNPHVLVIPSPQSYIILRAIKFSTYVKLWMHILAMHKYSPIAWIQLIICRIFVDYALSHHLRYTTWKFPSEKYMSNAKEKNSVGVITFVIGTLYLYISLATIIISSCQSFPWDILRSQLMEIVRFIFQ